MTGSPSPIRAIALMLTAMALLPGIDVIAKFLGQSGMPIVQIVWARLIFGALLTLPFAVRHVGFRGLLPGRPMMHLLRGALLMAATFFFFFSLKTLAIAEALSIFFVQPLIVTALSPFLLGEKVGPRRWLAVAVGFIGTLIIIRPGIVDVSVGTYYALAAGASLALYFLMTRAISGQAAAVVTTFHTNLMGTLVATVAVVLVWQAPTSTEWAMFILLGLVAVLGHYLITRAYDFGEASLLAPLAYTEIISSTIMGWYFFDNIPDGWTFVGVGVLIASAIYISFRERAQKQA
ncbi:MAG: DMT family transporter [Paracoccaceae bacterium]